MRKTSIDLSGLLRSGLTKSLGETTCRTVVGSQKMMSLSADAIRVSEPEVPSIETLPLM